MTDSLCLISVEKLAENKNYSNIVEFAFRNDLVLSYLINSKVMPDDRIDRGSDFDMLRGLVESMRCNRDASSRTYIYFDNVLRSGFGISAESVLSGNMTVEELWQITSKVLLKKENSLRDMIARSSLSCLGVAVAPWENAELEGKIGNTEIKKISCPLGNDRKNVWEALNFEDFSRLEDSICRLAKEEKTVAIFMDSLDFEFEKPNPYSASRAYEKIKNGESPREADRKIFKTQLVRDVFSNADEIMMILPKASNISKLSHIEQLIEYIDSCDFTSTKVTLFAGDVLSFGFASEMSAKRHKKITAEPAICGIDCHFIGDEIMYWGIGKLPEKTASLATSPAPFGKIIC